MTADDAFELLVDGSERARRTLVLAHGAGAPMDSPFMDTIAASVATRGICVVRFEFPYMAERRSTGKRRGPNTPAQLEETWLDLIATLGRPDRLVIGGKSMGGRIASMIADEAGVAGLACLGYPFHPPGQPTKLRTEHLANLETKTLILQGERDPFGTRQEVQDYELSKRIQIEWLADGDHSFKPRIKSGHTEAGHLEAAAAAVASFVEST